MTPLDPNQNFFFGEDWDLGDFYRDMWFMDNS